MSDKEDEKKDERKEEAGKEGPIEPDTLEKLPPQARRSLEMFFSAQRVFGPVYPPFLDKINAEHISKVLEISEKSDERDFKSAQSERKYKLIYLIIFCVVFLFLFVFLTVYLADRDKELYKDILQIGIGFLTGLAAGYGLGTRKKKQEED
jgi:hypothetical protein